ncbi:multidrug efflux pump subunit AcrB [Salsuginibacillus halophilus]|uniref:Multidrug efflux pump subunit AcrB n=1 Tax=Salsuginibacillus halophilus TaxID=517424 RepID=A0A2P8HQU1_9BACI|nr:efflux RND transporter permease subunit [Salsuginibacillus halophilus]PSL48554.1 multidrug efflux pump subunit AcrB [Salsuginibacillus halophilus]
MKSIIDWTIQKRKVTFLFFIMIIIVGAISLFQLPQREIPSIEPPVAQVSTVYPGASAEEVETNITAPLEEGLLGIAEVEEINSVSSPGISSITISFIDDGSIDQEAALNDAEQVVNDEAPALPDDAEEPAFSDDLNQQGLATYQITYEDETAFNEVNEKLNDWRSEFTAVPDIADLGVQGALEEELRITVDPEALADEGLAAGAVIGAIEGEIGTVPPGEWEGEDERYRLTLETYEQADELSTLSLNGDGLEVGDVADVEQTYAPREEHVHFEGEQALSLTFFLGEEASVPPAQDALDPVVAEFMEELPAGAEMELLYTQGDLVTELFQELAVAFLIAFASVLIVCSFGLNLPTALSVAAAVPVSISIGMTVLPFTDIGLNQISLIAFIIALGILVDDAIVVNENIERRLRLGEKPLTAASRGVRQVAASVITSTLTVVFTFMPLLLLPGSAGAFIAPLPGVLIAVIIASTVVALLLIPAYRYTIDSRKQKRSQKNKERKAPGLFGRIIDRGAGAYSERALTRVVKRPGLTALIGFILGTAAYGLIPFTPLEFFPDTDREEIFIETSLEEGSLLSSTEEAAEEVEAWLQAEPNVQTVSTYIGTDIPELFGGGSDAGGGAANETNANFLVYIDKEETAARAQMNEWSEDFQDDFPAFDEAVFSIIESGPPVGAPIAVEVSGEDIPSIIDKAEDIEAIFAETEGVANTTIDAGSSFSSYEMTPDRDALEESGLTATDVTEQLRLLGEGLPLGEVTAADELRELRLVYGNDGAVSPDDLNRIELSEQAAGGPPEEGPEPGAEAEPETTSLDELVNVEESTAVASIPRTNTERTVTVRAFPGERSEDDILAERGEEVEAFADEEHDVVIGGETEERTDVFLDIGQIFTIVVFLILIVIAVQFYSLFMPLIILSVVYLAISGAIIGLFITQTGLGFMSMMGGVALAGIVVRNGIVLIEFIEQRRRDGSGAADAVISAGRDRFRPIVLTSATSLAGVLPIALGDNPLFQPLGIAIAAGLIFSTVLTLFVVPALYLLKVRFIERSSRKGRTA